MTAIQPLPVRDPVWLAREDRDTLREAITSHLSNPDAARRPQHGAALEAVLLELAVTETRDRIWPNPTRWLRALHKRPPSSTRIRVSAAEQDALNEIPDLPETVRASLAEGRPR